MSRWTRVWIRQRFLFASVASEGKTHSLTVAPQLTAGKTQAEAELPARDFATDSADS